MLNPIECFIEVLLLNQTCDVLVAEVQQFLDFNTDKVLQQDQRKIAQDPALLITWFTQIEDALTNKQEEGDQYLIPLIQVQTLLINKFFQISNQNLLQEYYYIFEILQKKILYLKLYQPNELIQTALDTCFRFQEFVDNGKISAIGILLYEINKFNSTDKIEQFYQFLQKIDLKKHKLIEQQSNLILYAYQLLLQQCCILVDQNQNLDNVINICINIKEELKKQNQIHSNQCDLCILLSFYKLGRIQEFLNFSKQLEMNKTTPLEIQALQIVVKIKELQSENDFERIRIQIQRLVQQFLDNNLTHSVSDILVLLKEMCSNQNTYVFAFLILNQWFIFKHNLILRTTNQQNIQKLSKDIIQMLTEFPQILNIDQFNKEQIQNLSKNLIISLVEMSQSIQIIIQNIQKYQEIQLDEYLVLILNIIPHFVEDMKLCKHFGQLIAILSNFQLRQSQALQHLAMYLNLQFGSLPQTQTLLFQGLLKNYQSGIITAILLFLKEFQFNTKQEQRFNLCNQLKSLLQESYQLFERNQMPFYAILESCLKNEQNYYQQIVVSFFIEYQPCLNQTIYYFLLSFLEKCMKSNDTNNLDQLFQLLYQYLQGKNNLTLDLCKQTYNLASTQPYTLQKMLVKLFSYFMINMQMESCNIQFIKDTVMGNNQHKYQWKVDNNKSLFVIICDIIELLTSEQQYELINIKHLFELLFYLIEQNTKVEVEKVIPYYLRQIIKVAYNIKQDEFVFKILLLSLNHENLFLLLLLELQSYGGNRLLLILRKFIYEQSIPLYAYLLVICQIVEQSDTLDTILEMLPQLNQILRTTPIDENQKPFTQLLYLKLTALKEYVPIGKIDMICQSISLLSI